MAMTQCRECRKEVSNSAHRCPQCGIDNPSKTGGCAQNMMTLIMLPFIIAGIAVIFSVITGLFG